MSPAGSRTVGRAGSWGGAEQLGSWRRLPLLHSLQPPRCCGRKNSGGQGQTQARPWRRVFCGLPHTAHGAWPRSPPPRSRVCLVRTNRDLHLPKETTVSILPNLIGEADNSHLTSSTPPESENKHVIVFSHDKLPFCLFSALPRWHLLAAESHRR